MTFRKDINGLRAIAVISVVLFHFKVTGFSGGFIGVDIFFVISGYLMTAIIFNKLRDNKFSIIDFYLRRARRIIPALAVLCIVLIIFGYFNLITDNYFDLLKNIKKAILFISNVSFYKHSGYFDTPSSENWLLHTWSLSVEWQFYILYPIIVGICYKFFTENSVKFILVLICFFSLITSIILTPINQSAAFYLLPSRAWEMMAGGLVFLYPISIKFKFPLWVISILLIFISIFIIDANYLWPGYLALLPVIATMLIIWCNCSNFLLNNFLIQGLGKISYSLYLWHWPVNVLSYFSGIPNNLYTLCLKTVLSLILAMLSYFIIEKRKNNINNSLKGVIKYVSIIVLVLVSDNITKIILKKYPDLRPTILTRGADLVNVMDKFQCHKRQGNNISYCSSGVGQVSVIVLGDSHSNVISGILGEVIDGKVLDLSASGCPVLNEFTLKGNIENADCRPHVYSVLDKLNLEYFGIPVIISNYNVLYIDPNISGSRHLVQFDGISYKNHSAYIQKYKDTYVNTMCQISKKRPVYIIKPFPEMYTNVPLTIGFRKNLLLPFDDITISIDDYNQRNQFILEAMEDAKNKCGVTLLDPVPYLCPDNKKCMGSKNGKSLYMDVSHLNTYGKSFIYDLIRNNFSPVSH